MGSIADAHDQPSSSLDIFERLESEVRGYVRSFPVVFNTARGTTLWTADGREFLDFFAGAGALNYGHNNPVLKTALVEYIQRDGITHSLDMATTAKRQFIETFERCILKPRNLEYKFQFTGPTGTNAVEAALKLARQVTGRSTIVAFTHGFHGMSAGSLAATGNRKYRDAAGLPLSHVTMLPYDGYLGSSIDTLDYFEKLLIDPSSGLDKPAAAIVETVQGEGGINVASASWLARLRQLTSAHDILLIVDDIQAGAGRTGTFFSFEFADIVPDIVTLSKSVSGFGLPMSLVLLRPDLDVWKPGDHTGTFRGNNLAFITGRVAIETYWTNNDFAREIARKSEILRVELDSIVREFAALKLAARGRGLMYGLACDRDLLFAGRLAREAFRRGVIIETSGANDEVLKFLMPLTISPEELRRGLSIVRESVQVARGAANADAPELAAASARLTG